MEVSMKLHFSYTYVNPSLVAKHVHILISIHILFSWSKFEIPGIVHRVRNLNLISSYSYFWITNL